MIGTFIRDFCFPLFIFIVIPQAVQIALLLKNVYLTNLLSSIIWVYKLACYMGLSSSSYCICLVSLEAKTGF